MESWFVTHRKKLEEVDFVNQELLHKKIKWHLYVDYGVRDRRYSIPEDSFRVIKAVRHYGDLTALQ